MEREETLCGKGCSGWEHYSQEVDELLEKSSIGHSVCKQCQGIIETIKQGEKFRAEQTSMDVCI